MAKKKDFIGEEDIEEQEYVEETSEESEKENGEAEETAEEQDNSWEFDTGRISGNIGIETPILEKQPINLESDIDSTPTPIKTTEEQPIIYDTLGNENVYDQIRRRNDADTQMDITRGRLIQHPENRVEERTVDWEDWRRRWQMDNTGFGGDREERDYLLLKGKEKKESDKLPFE